MASPALTLRREGGADLRWVAVARPPKAQQLRLLRGDRRSRLNLAEPKPKPIPPKPPAWLSPAARVVWDDLERELEAIGLTSSADGAALAILSTAIVTHAEACRLVDAEGVLVAGDRGRQMKHPALQVVRDPGAARQDTRPAVRPDPFGPVGPVGGPARPRR